MIALSFVTETFAPLWRRRTYASALYLALALPIGVTAFVMLTVGAALGAGLAVVWVGVPILLALLATSRGFAAFDRGLANRLLGTAIAAPAAQRSQGGSIWQQVKSLVRASTTWRAILWLALRFPLSLIAFCVPVVLAATGIGLLITPFAVTFASAHVVLESRGLSTALCIAGGCALLVLTAHAVDAIAWVHAALARGLLGPSRSEEIAQLSARSERAESRAELARELHDSVGHSVTAAVLQASAARRVLDRDPEFAAGALEAIEAQGREALEELDRVLAVLREEDGEARPAPALADVDDLLKRTRAAGLPLTINRTGDFERVPATVGREAFRVVQEALTNVMRHASGASATVSLAVEERALRLTVENGPGHAIDPGRTGGGNGLRGVRERVRSLGGTLTTSDLADGGYVLQAELPLQVKA